SRRLSAWWALNPAPPSTTEKSRFGEIFLRQTIKRPREGGLLSEENGGLKLLVKLARRAGNINSARHIAFAVLGTLDDPRRLAAFGAVRALRGIHYLLAICCLCDLRHLSLLTKFRRTLDGVCAVVGS